MVVKIVGFSCTTSCGHCSSKATKIIVSPVETAKIGLIVTLYLDYINQKRIVVIANANVSILVGVALTCALMAGTCS